jgi:hypothetical protein
MSAAALAKAELPSTRSRPPRGLRPRPAIRLVIAGLCLLAVPRAAAAEWQFTPTIGFTFAGTTTLLDFQQAAGKRHAAFGGNVSLLGEGVIGAEVLAIVVPGFFETARSPLSSEVPRPQLESSRTTALMVNAVLTTPRRWTEYGLRPFVSGGFGVLHSSEAFQPTAVTPVPVFAVGTGLAGFNIGGGAVGFLTNQTGVRFDVRYYRSLRDTDQGTMAIGPARLHYMTVSVGLVIRR